MSNATTTLRSLLALAALASMAKADLITWGAPQDATGPSEVSTNGTLVTARNPWNTTSASPVVNGITFLAFAPTGWGNGGNLVMNGSTSGDAGYDTLLTTSRATSETTLTNPTNWGGIRLDTLGTLTVGNSYEIQVWFNDQRPGTGTAAINDRQMTLSSCTGVVTLVSGQVTNLGSLTQGPLSTPLEADPNNTSGAGDTIFGQYAIGTFTRTSTDQLWLLVQGSHPVTANTLRPHINAFQIRELPSSTPVTPFCFGDGTGAACPCANNGASGNGCANSIQPAGGALTASGIASIAGDTWQLAGSGLPNGPGLYFQGTTQLNAGNGIAFGDGLRCVGGSIVRLGIVVGVGNASTYPSGVTPPNNIPVSVKGLVTPGTYHYQLWYRDSDPSFCTAAVFNLTNGLSTTWLP